MTVDNILTSLTIVKHSNNQISLQWNVDSKYNRANVKVGIRVSQPLSNHPQTTVHTPPQTASSVNISVVPNVYYIFHAFSEVLPQTTTIGLPLSTYYGKNLLLYTYSNSRLRVHTIAIA